MNPITSKELNLFYLLLIVMFLTFLITYPTTWMITDSNAYFNNAKMLLSAPENWIGIDVFTGNNQIYQTSQYGIGNSLWLSIWILIGGNKAVFLGSFLAVAISALLIFKTLENLQLKSTAILLFFLIPPLQFYSRSIMSCLPSLLLVSWFLYLYSKKSNKIWISIFLGLITFGSTIVRETNIILLFPFLVAFVVHSKSQFKYVALGSFVGIGVRIGLHWFIFGDALYLSESEGFSVSSLINHMTIYLFILLILVPGGIMWLYSFFEKKKWPYAISTILFIGLYMSYNYTAVPFSGFLIGNLLTSRFIIPLIPLIIIGFAYFLEKHTIQKSFVTIIYVLAILHVIGMQVFIKNKYAPYEHATIEINKKYKDSTIIYDPTTYSSTIRMINPMQNRYAETANIHLLSSSINREIVLKNKNVVFVITENTSNDAKTMRTDSLKHLISYFPVVKIDSFLLGEKNQVEIYKVERD